MTVSKAPLWPQSFEKTLSITLIYVLFCFVLVWLGRHDLTALPWLSLNSFYSRLSLGNIEVTGVDPNTQFVFNLLLIQPALSTLLGLIPKRASSTSSRQFIPVS